MEVGMTLRNARESQGISLEDAEHQTKIRKKYLVALEEENFDVVPGEVYVRGFLRNYARFLGINGEDLVDRYNEYVGSVPRNDDMEDLASQTVVSQRVFGRRRYVWVALLGVVLVAGLVFFLSGIVGSVGPGKDISQGAKEKLESGKVQENEPQPEENPSAQGNNNNNDNEGNQDSVPVKGINLVLSFSDRCWMQIKEDQEVAFEGFAFDGDRKEFTGEDNISVHVGNAGAVKAIVNGVDRGVLGERGQPLRMTFGADNEGNT